MTARVLKLEQFLLASLPPSLTDSGWRELRDRVLKMVGEHRARGVLVDVGEMDVLDSYATRLLDGLSKMLRLRGARTVVVGLQPGVAFAMAQLGLKLRSSGTALDVDDGLAYLRRRASRSGDGR
ncbi:MAG TPA: STAS domain-containing protein [Myxococcaceae bacterium]|nr:STAS domain-containing protein [Myxococcaceae bacterium]